jgi:tetratricopeptide (TPR) repeat protein
MLALLSKPAAVVVPAVAGLVAVAGLGQPWSHAARALGGWLGAALLCGVLTKGQQLDAAMAFLPPLWARPVIVADSLSFYLGKLVWPVDLGPDYGRTPPLVLAQGGQYLPALGLLVLGATLWRVRVQYRELWLAMGVFVASLLPVLGGVSFLFQEHSTVADRYTYLALLGPALGVAGWLRRPRRWWSWGVAGLLVLALCGWRSAAQVRVWQNTATLFAHALRINPLSAPSHNNLGWVLARQGQLDLAVAHFMRALQLKPLMLEAHYNLGDALADKGQLDDAIAHYTWVVQRKPTWFEAHHNLASALLRQDRLDDAMAHYLQAQQLKPHWSLPYNNVGNVLCKQGKLQEAIPWFTRAAQLTPVLPEAPYNLGGVWQQQGRYAEAIMAYREALRRRPHWPQANVQLARVLLSQAQPTLQEITEAVALAERACQASDYRHAIPLRTLAVAYYAAQQPAAAVRTARQALDIARTTGDPALVAEITAQIQQYERTQSSQTLPADTPQAP